MDHYKILIEFYVLTHVNKEWDKKMKKILYFLMVGLAFTAFQVGAAEAQTGTPATAAPMGDPNMAPPTGAPGTAPMGDPNMAPPTGASGTAPMGNISHCAEFSGPPKVACEAAAAGN